MASSTSCSPAASTSPACVCLSLATPPISPGPNSSACSWSLPCGASSWPIRSFSSRAAVDHVRVGPQHAPVDAEQVDPPGERVGQRLEHQRHQSAGPPPARAWPVRPSTGAAARRRGQVLDQRVQQPARAQVARGRAAGDGEDGAAGHAGLQRGHDLLVRDLVSVEVVLHQLVGDLGHLVHELLAVLVGLRAQRIGNVDLLGVGPPGAAVAVGLHVDQVDQALQLVRCPDRDLGGHHVGAERRLQRFQRREEVSPLAVEHVHVEQARQPQLLRPLPQPLGAHLDAGDRVDHEHRALAHAQRGQRVGHEAGLARRVDQGDLALAPADTRPRWPRSTCRAPARPARSRTRWCRRPPCPAG